MPFDSSADVFDSLHQDAEQQSPTPPDQTQENDSEAPVSTAADIALAPVRGVVKAGQNVYNLGSMLTGGIIPEWENNPLGDSKTAVGSLIQGVTEFGAGLVAPELAIGKLASAGKLADWGLGAFAHGFPRALTSGAVADFSAFDPHQQRLSDLIQSNPTLANPVNDFLSSKSDDSDAEGRFKNALEGLGFGAVTESLLMGLKALKGGKAVDGAALAKSVGQAEATEPAVAKEVQAGDATTGAEPAVAPGVDVPDGEKPATTEAAPAEPAAPKADELPIQPDTIDKIDQLYKSGKSTDEIASSIDPAAMSIDKIKGDGDVARWLVSTSKALEGPLSDIKTHVSDAEAISNAVETYGEIGGDTAEYLNSVAGDLNALPKLRNISETVNLLWAGMKKDISDKAVSATLKGDNLSARQLEESINRARLLLPTVNKLNEGAGRLLRSRSRTDFQGLDEVAPKNTLNLDTIKPTEDYASAVYANQPVSPISVRKRAAAIQAALGPDGKNFGRVGEVVKGGRLLDFGAEVYTSGLLSAPITAARVLIGNATQSTALPLVTAVGNMYKGILDGALMKPGGLQEALVPLQAFRGWYESSTNAFRLAAMDAGAGRMSLYNSGQIGQDFSSRLSMEGLAKASPALAGQIAGNPVLSNVMNGLFAVGRVPGKLITGIDNFFTIINAHAGIKVNAYADALQQVKKGTLGSGDVEQYVDSVYKQLVDTTGNLYSRDRIASEGTSELNGLLQSGQVKTADSQQWLTDYIKSKWNEDASRIYDSASWWAHTADYKMPFDPNNGWQDKLGSFLQKFGQDHPIFRMTCLPFVKAPVRILGETMDYLPFYKVPGLTGLNKRYLNEINSGDPLRASYAQGKMALGSAAAIPLLMAANSGIITGSGPADPAEKQLLLQTGWQPNSFHIGGTYINYEALEPYSTLLGMAGDISYRMDRIKGLGEQESTTIMSALAMSVAENLTDKSYLQGISNILDGLMQPEEKGVGVIKNMVGSFVPNILRRGGKAFGPAIGDDYLHETRTILDSITGNFPGAGDALDPKRNALGEKVVTPWGPTDFVNPLKATSDSDADPVLKEMSDLHEGFGAPKYKIAGGLINLAKYRNASGQTAYDRWQELSGTLNQNGQTLRGSLSKLIQSPGYLKLQNIALPDIGNPRAALITRTMNQYRDSALLQTRREFPQLNRDYVNYHASQTAYNNGGNPLDYLPAQLQRLQP